MKKLLALLISLGFAQASTYVFAEESASNSQEQPLSALPYTPSLDVASMDKSANPCEDFYQYTCGGWMKNNPIPEDQASWDVYSKLAQENQRFLWGILDSLSQNTAGRSPTQQKIGDYFAACMDEPAINKLGMTPITPLLDRITALKSKQGLAPLLADLHQVGIDSYFGFGANQDDGDSTQFIAIAASDGLGLPDRDYYLKTDKKSKELRAKYLAHVAKMLEMSGDQAKTAKANATHIMAIETALAKATLDNAEKRDPYKMYHKMDAKQLQALTPGFDWPAYLKEAGLSDTNTFNVTEPAFFQGFEKVIKTSSLTDIKTYLRWHLLMSTSSVLSKDYADTHFDFYGKTLMGVPKQEPRWRRCTQLVDAQLGEALGQEFVSRAFSPKLKEDTLHMTQQIEAAMEKDIQELTWMSQTTKEKALEKLHGIANKIGYPEKWRDYSSVDIKRDDFFGNYRRAATFEIKRQLAKIGKPVDRDEWGMTPPTVNAYYSPQMNDINFPAGVLQPPLYDPKMDDAPNYGNTGGTIGHELTHGFDDNGRQYDAKGNLKDWWTKDDAKAFTERAQCVIDQYGKYTVIDDLKIKSKLTQGEDIADLGGLVLAWMAWKSETMDKQLTSQDGLTPEQRFFVGYAQWACTNIRPEAARVRALTDPHSPGKYRVNGLMVNMPEFKQAFSCQQGQAMVSDKPCRVW